MRRRRGRRGEGGRIRGGASDDTGFEREDGMALQGDEMHFDVLF